MISLLMGMGNDGPVQGSGSYAVDIPKAPNPEKIRSKGLERILRSTAGFKDIEAHTGRF